MWGGEINFVKAEGPLRNLLEAGREVVCAEGLLRRDNKVPLRLCILRSKEQQPPKMV